MKSHMQYLRYVARHKWYVFLAGLRLGVPLWRLIAHDWTKFTRREWGPYVRFFYGDIPSSKTGGPPRPATLEFELAWNHHQHKNDHHWQFWVRIGDDGTELILPMGESARKEMLADWRGAGRALGKPNTLAWYLDNRHKMKLHEETRAWVENALGVQRDFQIVQD